MQLPAEDRPPGKIIFVDDKTRMSQLHRRGLLRSRKFQP